MQHGKKFCWKALDLCSNLGLHPGGIPGLLGGQEPDSPITGYPVEPYSNII